MGGIRTNVGYGSLLPMVDSTKSKAMYAVSLKQEVAQAESVRELRQSETRGLVTVPLISRYYEASSNELYGKNVQNLDLTVIGEEDSQGQP